MEKPYNKAGSLALCILLALNHPTAHAQDATAGLYICTGADGMNNITSQPSGGNCRPYQKGAIGGDSAPAPAASAMPVTQPTPQPAPMPLAAPPANDDGGFTWDDGDTPAAAPQPAKTPTRKTPAAQPAPQAAAAPVAPVSENNDDSGFTWDDGDAPAKPAAPAKVDKKVAGKKDKPAAKDAATADKKPSAAPQAAAPAAPSTTAANNPLFPPAPGYTSAPQGSGKYYQHIARGNGKAPAQPTAPAAEQEEKTIATVTPQGTQIWMCPQLDGTPTIIETATPPQGNCQPLGRKGTSGDISAPAPPAPNRGKPLVGESTPQEAPAQDIYKCFDNDGKPNFVPADKRDKYKGCTFFSRSYSGVKQQFIQQANQTQSLEALASAGVQKNKDGKTTGGPGLQCTGAGAVTFNGETREFNCATRSFDYTPGTSGGEARLGSRQTSIAAHNLDYLNTQGSCGGTVTSENGRVFHLEPTKDCPQSYIIEAERIAAEVRRELNINVSGAFRERQRNLSAQINQIALEIGVEPHFVHAIISAESAYKPGAKSHAGAMGLMQLMPGTARRFGVTEPYNTGQNVRGGATYLKWLLNEFDGDMQLAAAGYNAGEGNVRKYGRKIPPFIETRAYVPKVMEYYRRYKNNPSEIGL
nr:lytic transglycosylase domain-containing protein [uncultured Cardiobacterium sp.]